jgi:hypothetical protein
MIVFPFRGLCVGVLLILLAAGPAWPQRGHHASKNRPKLGQFDLSGTLDRVEGNALMLTTAADFTWILRPKPKVDIFLSGKAAPAFLAPGQAVVFLAKLDTRRGTTVEEVHRLTVFVPDKKRPLGIRPDLGFGDLEKASFGEQLETGEVKWPEGEPRTPQSRSTSRRGAASAKSEKHVPKEAASKDVDSFVISGRILSVNKGTLRVLAPNVFLKQTELTVTIAADANIAVELTGLPALALVQQGDHVQASGDQTGPGLGEAASLRLRIDRLLGAPAAAKKPNEKRGGKGVRGEKEGTRDQN